jgi:hypothetical protein
MALRPYRASRDIASAALNPFGVVSSFRNSAATTAELAEADTAVSLAAALPA